MSIQFKLDVCVSLAYILTNLHLLMDFCVSPVYIHLYNMNRLDNQLEGGEVLKILRFIFYMKRNILNRISKYKPHFLLRIQTQGYIKNGVTK